MCSVGVEERKVFCAELHDGRRDSFRFHECTLDVKRECKWFLAEFASLFIGPSDLGLSRDGEDDSIQVDAIKNEQARESAQNIAGGKLWSIQSAWINLLLIGFVAIWFLQSVLTERTSVEFEFDKVLQATSACVCLALLLSR